MRINEDYLDNIAIEDAVTNDDEFADNVANTNQDDYTYGLIFAVVNAQETGIRMSSLRNVVKLVGKFDMFFNGEYRLFYQDNQRSEMKPLMSIDEIADDDKGLKLCLSGSFNNLASLWRFFYCLAKCGIDRMFLLKSDVQIQFFYMKSVIELFERPERFRFYEYREFYGAMTDVIMMFGGSQKDIDKFCQLIHFNRFEAFLLNNKFVYQFMGHYDDVVDMKIPDELQQKIEAFELNLKEIIKKSEGKQFVNNWLNQPDKQFRENEMSHRVELMTAERPIKLSHPKLYYYVSPGLLKVNHLFFCGYLAMYKSHSRSERYKDVYIESCIGISGEVFFDDNDNLKRSCPFVQRVSELFGEDIAIELANVYANLIDVQHQIFN